MNELDYLSGRELLGLAALTAFAVVLFGYAYRKRHRDNTLPPLKRRRKKAKVQKGTDDGSSHV